MNALKSVLLAGVAAITGSVEKRAGLYVNRPVLNGEAWHKWAVANGIPKPVPADQMHVTICHSAVDVKCKPQTNSYEIATERAVVQHLGANGDVLTILFHDCYLADRHYFLRENGATSDWSGFRPHVTLSYSAAGFEISDEAMKSMPEMLVLGPEIHDAPNPEAVANLKKSIEPAAEMVKPDAEDAAAAAKALSYVLKEGLGNALERAALTDLAAGRDVSSGDIASLQSAEWSAKAFEGAEALGAPAAPDPTHRGSNESQLVKRADEERIAYGWASVAVKVDGQTVLDLQDDEITTDAQKELLHALIRGKRAGNIDHVGDVNGEIVEGIVFTEELWKALEPYIGQEGLFIGMHFADPADWAKTEGRNMFSIGCTAVSVEVP